MIPKMNDYKNRWALKSDDVIKPGLKAIEDALVKVGNPEKELKIIHVTGTNGKGSTIAFMEQVLKEHGLTAGVFSSPAIKDVHDQIRINGESISEAGLNLTFKTMKEAGLSGLLTDFELLTVAALVTFERCQPDYVLLEVGMGGLLDSTNVVTPLVSVITSIALDHTAFLGSSIKEVASHKAGIIKRGVPVVTGLLEEEALCVVRTIAEEMGSPLSAVEKLPNIGEMKMKGEHQRRNAAVAIKALERAGIILNTEAVERGVANAKLAHRFEEISPGVFLDGAHNPAAAKALTETIRTEFPGEKVNFIIGMVKGKEIEKTLDELIPVAASFTFLTFEHPDAVSGDELMKNCKFRNKRVTKAESETILLVMEEVNKSIVTGSLYLLANLRGLRKNL